MTQTIKTHSIIANTSTQQIMKVKILFMPVCIFMLLMTSCKRGTISDPLECLWSISLLYKDKNTGENLISQNEPFILDDDLQSKFIYTNNGDTVLKNFCCSSIEYGNVLEIESVGTCDYMGAVSGRSWDCHFTIQYKDLSMPTDTFRIQYDRNSDVHTASLYYNDSLLEKKELLPIHGYHIIFNTQTIEK